MQRVTHRVVPIRPSADFSTETLQARWGWQEVVKVMKSKKLQPRLFYSVKLSLRIKGQVRVLLRQGKAKGVHHHQAIIT